MSQQAQAQANVDDFTKPPIKEGTTESQALKSLGTKRREMTGVLGRESKIRFLSISSGMMKPMSILNSALGLTITILLMVESTFWSTTFWISFFVGIAVGVFFELWSTNSEHAFVMKDELDEIADPDKGIYQIILISIKTYAVVMVLVSAWNLPDYIFVQNQNQDDKYIVSRLEKIERLKSDKEKGTSSNTDAIYQKLLVDLKNDKKKIQAEITKELKENSVSTHPKKRTSAIEMIKSINDRVAKKDAEILKTSKEMISSASKTPSQIYEDQITVVEAEIEDHRKVLKATAQTNEKGTLGITIMLGVLFVFLELGGTTASILAGRAILSSVSPEEAYKDSVTNGLFNNKIALLERNNRLKATKIEVDIEQNVVMTDVIARESLSMAQNHKLIESARLAEIDRENAKLLSETSMRELESQQLLELTKGVKQKLDGIETIRKQIGGMIRDE